MKPVLAVIDFEQGRWARYEGRQRMLRGNILNENPRTLDWHDTVVAIRELPATLPLEVG